MSHDGTLEVEWKGQAFPYLMHHPRDPRKTDSYGSHRNQDSHGASTSGSDNTSENFHKAGTGTWNGPAPRGYLHTQQASASAAKPEVIKEPDSVLLSSGQRMPIIGLGTFQVESADVIKKALDIGYRHIDCAAVYGNEVLVGEGIKDFVSAGNREQLFITSKVWNTQHRPADVRAACQQTLKDLGLAYLDLYLVHWPEAWLAGSTPEAPKADTEVTIQQTWQAMEQLVDDGLVKAIGVSNFSLAQVEDVLAFARIKPVVNQVELHPHMAQRKLLGVCYRKGVHCVAYSPLGSPKSKDLISDQGVAQLAAELGKTPGQVLLKWNTQRGVPVIPKSSSEAHLRENLEGMSSWKLSYPQKEVLDKMDCGRRYIDFPWKDWGNPEEGGAGKASRVLADADMSQLKL